MEIRIYHDGDWWLFPTVPEFTEEELQPYLHLPMVQKYNGERTRFHDLTGKEAVIKLLDEMKRAFPLPSSEKNNFKIGEVVSWTHSRSAGNSLTLYIRQGVIEKIKEGWATIRLPSKRTTMVSVRRLRRLNEKSQLTEFVEAVRDATTKENEENDR